jgi:hypothetical protein
MRKGFPIIALLLGFALPGTVLAGPAAMVEDVAGDVAGVGVLDYLAAGKVIRLATTDRLVLDYFHSCVRETIAGGLVTVGLDQSVVSGGNVTRDKVACDGGQLQLSAAEAEASAVIVFRGTSSNGDKKLPAPQRTLYGSSPLVELPGGGMLVIERLDKPEERLVYQLNPADMIHGRFYDFAQKGDSLDPGGLYRATARGRSVVFALSPAAAPGAAPPVSRLLKL